MFSDQSGSSQDGHAGFAQNQGAPPTAAAAWQEGSPAPSHLAQSILVTLFCCQPCGIVAIVFSAIAMGKNSSGDYEGAAAAAKTASIWAWVGFGVGLVVILLYAGMVILAAAASP